MAWIGPVVQGVTGLAQTIAASSAAKNLPDAKKYEATPQMKKAEAMAERRAEQGMSQSERALFEQGMARRTSAAEKSMRNLGLSGGGISGLFNIDAQNQFSAQSEAERRKGEAMYAGIAGQMQGIQDRETTSFNQMLQQQRTALGGAAASGMKNITGAFGMAAQAANTNKLAEAYANSGDTYNYNLGGGTDPMGKMEAPTSDLLPTVDTSAPPAIPAGAGYPGITFDPYAPTMQSYQLPTDPLGTPQIPYSAGGAGYGIASDLGAYGPSQAVQPNLILQDSGSNPNSAFNLMMNRMSPSNPFGSFQ
tara:strand:- start:117 stop:1034 length:918 start_codon:yes stop_codon:yes gene_type:complete